MHRHHGSSRWLDPGPGGWADPAVGFLAVALGRFVVLIVLALVALALAGCGGSRGLQAGQGGDDPGRLVGTIWRLEHLDVPGTGQVPLTDPGKYVLQLQHNGRLGVRADCVTCVGAYNADTRILQMQLDCPQVIGCGPGSQAELFIGTLEQVRTFDLEGDRLRLFNLDNSGVMTLARVLRFE